MRFIRRLFRAIFSLVTIVILLAVGVLGWLTLTEYQPADVEIVTAVAGARHDEAQAGKLYRIVSLNVGYGGLGSTEDFMMDGGKGVLPKNKAEVQGNLNELLTALLLKTPDICFLQEVDTDSNRSYYINEADHFSGGLRMGSAFALNFKCDFVPFPWPPIGKVQGGGRDHWSRCYSVVLAGGGVARGNVVELGPARHRRPRSRTSTSTPAKPRPNPDSRAPNMIRDPSWMNWPIECRSVEKMTESGSRPL